MTKTQSFFNAKNTEIATLERKKKIIIDVSNKHMEKMFKVFNHQRGTNQP